MPTNLPGDNFDLESSHILPALLQKFHEAKTADFPHVTIWGTGTPRREFLHVDDLASTAVFLMKCYDSSEILNVGVGYDVTIAELAKLVADCVGYRGDLVFDSSKPDGNPRKLLDVSKLDNLGWRPSIALPDGIRSTYTWFLQHVESGSAIPAVH